MFSVVSTLSLTWLPEKMIHSKTNSPLSNHVSDNVLTTDKMIHSKTNSPLSNHVSDNVLTTEKMIHSKTNSHCHSHGYSVDY
jgi:protein-disulfide isomerase-like protein with CxxC motif